MTTPRFLPMESAPTDSGAEVLLAYKGDPEPNICRASRVETSGGPGWRLDPGFTIRDANGLCLGWMPVPALPDEGKHGPAA